MHSKQKHILHIGIPYIVLSVLTLLFGGADLYLKVTYQQGSNLAVPEVFYGETSSTPLKVRVSTDGKRPTSSITIPAGTTKYYLHTNRPNIGFEALVTNGNHVKPWGSYRSNSQGVARIDVANLPANTYKARFRPLGSREQWSNEITVVAKSSSTTPSLMSLSSVSSQGASTNLADYFVMKPGYVWMYETKNYNRGSQSNPATGKTRLQIEEKTEICGVSIFPWRYTKDSENAYWGPSINTYGKTEQKLGGNKDLRWLVVDPAYNYGKIPAFNNFIWAYGHKTYERSNIRDINFGKEGVGYIYLNKTGRVPGYNLSPKTLGNKSFMDVAEYESKNTNDTSCKDILKDPDNRYSSFASGYSSWKIRTEKDRLTIRGANANEFSYDGEVIRIDYFEGSGSLEKDQLLRESWYVAKGIGVVKIVGTYFNNYGGTQAPACSQNSDCFSDRIEKPAFEVTLKQYFQNPQLRVSVSVDNRNFQDSITLTTGQGYYFKVDNVPYTGYLEALITGTTTPGKWLWVENGRVSIPYDMIKNLAGKSIKARFRIWVPSEDVVGERRIRTTNLPWSNEIEVAHR